MFSNVSMAKFYKGDSIEDIKRKIKDMFSISHSFINLNCQEDDNYVIYADNDEEDDVVFDSTFDYKFEEILNKKESKIALNEIEEVIAEIAACLQDYDEAYSNFGYCTIPEENVITISMTMIVHEI